MITPLTEPSINKSVINRRSCISRRRNMIAKQTSSKPMEKNIVKKSPKIIDIKPVVKKECIQQEIIEEIKPRYIENKPTEERIKQEPVNTDSMEEAIRTAVNDTPIERKVEIKQHDTYNIFDNRTVNMNPHYAYNSILGTRVYYT